MLTKKITWAGVGLICLATNWAVAGGAPQQRAAQAIPMSTSDDVTPPVLTAFNVGTFYDAGVQTGQLVIDLSLTDDLSGVSTLHVSARGPSGQSVDLDTFFDGDVRLRTRLPLHFNPYVEPGDWEINVVEGYDRAGNYYYVNATDLAALGNVRFKVVNNAVDRKLPKLNSGKVLTPTVSRSATAPGAPSHGAAARAQALVSDAGSRVLSGVDAARLDFCMPEGTSCISLWHRPQGVYGEAKRTVQLAGSVHRDQAIGIYHLNSALVSDHAGNVRTYQSISTGGETDFSTIFSSTTITVTP